MRRYVRVALLCLGCGLCSLLYGSSQLALEQEPGWGKPQARDPAAPVRRQRAGGGRAAAAGSAGRGEPELPDRCGLLGTPLHTGGMPLPDKEEPKEDMLQKVLQSSDAKKQEHKEWRKFFPSKSNLDREYRKESEE